MKNIKLIYLAVGLLAIATPQLTHAEDPKPATPPPASREELREKIKNMTPEERAAAMKEYREKNPGGGPGGERRAEEMKKMAADLGLNPEDLKDLSPEERRAKVKEASDKKLAELQKKKTDGTITDAEKETLQRLEDMKKMMERRRDDGTPGGRPRPPAPATPADKPAEKPADK